MRNPSLIRFAISAIVMLALAGGYAVWLGKVRDAQDESAALASEIADKNAARSVGVSRGELAELSESEAAIRSHLVAADGIVPFLESLESLAESFGASASVASVSDPDAEGRIKVALSVSGSFDAVMRTVGAIENGDYGSATETLTLDANGEGGWRAALIFEVATPRLP